MRLPRFARNDTWRISFRKILGGEGGQALPAALILLLLGGLLVVPGLALMYTNLSASLVVDQATRGLYAADSGVEDALQQLKYTESWPPSSPWLYPLSEDVNSMSVATETTKGETYTLVAGEFVTLSGTCSERLQIQSQMGDEPIDDDVYEYTITVHADDGAVYGSLCGGHIKLVELGAMLPAGYSYVENSAAPYTEDQLSTGDPEKNLDGGSGAWMLTWTWGGGGLQITGDDPNAAVTKYQRFCIAGTGSHEGTYAWTEAKRQNIGIVGEITGTLYTITATATQDVETTATVTAEVMRIGSAPPYDVEIISWQINSPSE